jgi:hypothetical protein
LSGGHLPPVQTVGNALHRDDIPPAPERKHTGHLGAIHSDPPRSPRGNQLLPGNVVTFRGLVTYYVPFFIHLESRRVDIAGITAGQNESWMQQIARNVTVDGCGREAEPTRAPIISVSLLEMSSISMQ